MQLRPQHPQHPQHFRSEALTCLLQVKRLGLHDLAAFDEASHEAKLTALLLPMVTEVAVKFEKNRSQAQHIEIGVGVFVCLCILWVFYCCCKGSHTKASVD